MSFSGAGVFIVEVPRNGSEIRLVLFHDKRKHAYADPGGKCEQQKHNGKPQRAALDELYEESASLLKANRRTLNGAYVERETKRRGRYYRAYFLITDQLSSKEYKRNVRKLREMNAPHYLQETDRMARIRLSEAFRAIDRKPNAKRLYANTVGGKQVLLHRRVVDMLREVFRDSDPNWLLSLIENSDVATYNRIKKSDGLIEYRY